MTTLFTQPDSSILAQQYLQTVCGTHRCEECGDPVRVPGKCDPCEIMARTHCRGCGKRLNDVEAATGSGRCAGCFHPSHKE